MAEKLIDAGLLALLGRIDTPSVCNAIEVAQEVIANAAVTANIDAVKYD